MVRRQGVLLVLDGLGDRGQRAFNGLTPLEAARTPNFDRLLGGGQGALVDPLFPGVPVGTHTGTGALLGIPPAEVALLPRGPVEMAGTGHPPGDGDILMRCNFATLSREDGELQVLDRRAGRIREGTDQLARALEGVDLGDGIRGTLIPATQHRAILQLRGPGLSPDIGDTDPGGHQLPLKKCLPTHAGAAPERTARAVDRFTRIAHQRLEQHPLNLERRRAGLPPANGVICRSAGAQKTPGSLIHHLGLKAALVSGESTVIGLGRLLGYRVVTHPGFTALPDTDLQAKAAAVETALETADIVFLHIKGPDICAHDLNPAGKRRLLEAIDGAIAPLIRPDRVIGVTGDHSTDCNTGDHVGDPVPSLLWSADGRRDGCQHFGESGCAGGGLGRVTANGFLCALLDAMGCMHKFRPQEAGLFRP